ncbi:MAG: N-acetylmuramoyl-L-alanine amidase [Betaproteobacteria bacterium]|nr:N-acetylmuramoyl-L-alanine amidase [Betaproteobacteria bacterium]MDE2622178.1 N-acetylmuramoyl-L-alanine amidase [Betaproteobacteria bacterium]
MPRTHVQCLTRFWILAGLALALSVPIAAFAGTRIDSVRLWPAEEYTRVTFEAHSGIHSSLFTIENPERLVLDLEGVDTSPAVKSMIGLLKADDPYIKGIRVGRFKPGVLRVVFDLKAKVKASASLLQPVGEYGYRLILDIYPETPADPLMAFLDKRAADAGNASPEPHMDVAKAPPAPHPDAEAQVPPHAGSAAVVQAPSLPAVAPAVSAAAKAAPAPVMPPAPAVPSTRPRSDSRILVAVDAGHGGEDPGARGHGGTYEKNVTLAVARRLKSLIDAQPGMRAVLIRDGDYFIPLQGRTAKARRYHADLFVSIHADAYINGDARGSSVFALSEKGATSVAARWLAKRENDSDLIGGVNINRRETYLAQTLFDLSQTATINDSLKMARAVLGELSHVNALHKGEVEQAGFAVLKSPDIPSILVETAFITNPEEERRLNQPEYQDKLAHAILSGIQRYLSANPPLNKARSIQSGLKGRQLAVSP